MAGRSRGPDSRCIHGREGRADAPAARAPRWGAAYRDYLAKSFTRQVAMVAQTENLPYSDQVIDLDPDVKDAWGNMQPSRSDCDLSPPWESERPRKPP